MSVMKFQHIPISQRQAQTTNLFVDHVPFGMTEKDIHDLFSKFGEVRSIKVKMPNTPSAGDAGILQDSNLAVLSALHGMAYVDFATEEAASKALTEL